MILPGEKALTVSEINKYIKARLSADENLRFVFIKGEISNWKPSPTGHIYFSLKDNDSIIGAVMFNNYAQKLSTMPKNGDEVIVCASIDVYVPRGNYQLMVYEMNPLGMGTILAELEELKKKLQKEGLFDESRKRGINLYPRAVGVITAPNGAAIKDIVTNLHRRYPIADIYLFPSSVQGENAPRELLKAFNESQKYDLDTLIIGRGGGASEDLSAFNDETLVRAIANSKMPVIAAVGHEIDTTLVDYVADKRASTPTGAAELATVDRREIEQRLEYAREDMENALVQQVKDMEETIAERKSSMAIAIRNKIELLKTKLIGVENYLKASNPKLLLEKGYSLTVDDSGLAISDINKVKKGQNIKTIMKNGTIESVVTNIKEK